MRIATIVGTLAILVSVVTATAQTVGRAPREDLAAEDATSNRRYAEGFVLEKDRICPKQRDIKTCEREYEMVVANARKLADLIEQILVAKREPNAQRELGLRLEFQKVGIQAAALAGQMRIKYYK